MKKCFVFSILLIAVLILNSCKEDNRHIIQHQKFYINNPMPLEVKFRAKARGFTTADTIIIDTIIPSYQSKLVCTLKGGNVPSHYLSFTFFSFYSLFLGYDTKSISSNFGLKTEPYCVTTYERSGSTKYYDVEVFTLTIDTLIFK